MKTTEISPVRVSSRIIGTKPGANGAPWTIAIVRVHRAGRTYTQGIFTDDGTASGKTDAQICREAERIVEVMHHIRGLD